MKMEYDTHNITKLSDFDINELNNWLAARGFDERASPIPAYRGKQILKWIGRGVQAFDDMTTLPRELRKSLAANAIIGMPEIIAEMRSPNDGTIKFGMKTHDNCVVETVLMRYKHGCSICVSSQAGCRRGCAFCATDPGSFARSLSPGEMFGQVAVIAKLLGGRGPKKRNPADFGISGKNELRSISNIVVMGIGEPFDNYDNTLKFIKLLHDNEETNYSYRRVTISTCGVLPGILRLAEEGLPIGLAVSLHAADDITRSTIMPVNHRYSIDKLIEGCKIYTCKTNRRVTFEYALIDGVNDAPDDAKALLRKVRGMLCHINLIPVNMLENTGFAPSSRERIMRFADILSKAGAQMTVRRELGTDIMAACGQLRNSIAE